MSCVDHFAPLSTLADSLPSVYAFVSFLSNTLLVGFGSAFTFDDPTHHDYPDPCFHYLMSIHLIIDTHYFAHGSMEYNMSYKSFL
jgi:hypothetical protein